MQETPRTDFQNNAQSENWLLVISHTLLMLTSKGSGNSSVYLKLADWSYIFPVTRKVDISLYIQKQMCSRSKGLVGLW